MSVENTNSRQQTGSAGATVDHPLDDGDASGKENDMDWNAIFFAVVLPFFIVGAIGLGVYAQRLPG
jgi:hypothetical protein